MAWKGTFRVLGPGDEWAGEDSIAGVIETFTKNGIVQVSIADVYVEDGPFEDGEEVELLCRRVKNGG